MLDTILGSDVFESLKIEIWNLFDICYLMLEI